MTRRLVIVAHPLEAEALGQLPFQSELIVSGVGMLHAATATMQHAAHFDEVWNLGVVGALKPRIAIGAISEIKLASKYLAYPQRLGEQARRLAEETHPSVTLSDEGWQLLSSDFPIHAADEREALGTRYDVVDMEGYGIAIAAKRAQKPCFLWKVVSDICTDAKLIKQRIPPLMRALRDSLPDLA